ncbi:MAG TPA: 5'/3'-nucleotidase SurE [Candidatus Binatia bacterium]|nr:5'/3'-nucleotidase SurE [Candidatus Binatia bacterium]
MRTISLRAVARMAAAALVAACMLASTAAPSAALGFPMRVLVTNDDGVGAEGISVLVAHLSAIRGLEVDVVAPATNQSGTGDNYSTTPLDVFSSMTAAGHPATAVRGFPSDATLWGTLSGQVSKPDLIVSGINFGQNIAEAVTISGTVGAALTGARMGIPGFAVSQGLAQNISYEDAAVYTAQLVERFRSSATFRRLLTQTRVRGRARILNINFPSCTEGSLRGVRVAIVGRATRVVGYEQTDPGVWTPTIERTPVGSNDCRSVLRDPRTDLEAMNNGFASVTMLNPDLTNDEGTLAVRRYVEQ